MFSMSRGVAADDTVTEIDQVSGGDLLGEDELRDSVLSFNTRPFIHGRTSAEGHQPRHKAILLNVSVFHASPFVRAFPDYYYTFETTIIHNTLHLTPITVLLALE